MTDETNSAKVVPAGPAVTAIRKLAEVAKALASRDLDPEADAITLERLDDLVAMAVRITEATGVLNLYAASFYRLADELHDSLVHAATTET
jgi:hypothetical protein